jgi:Ca-activated chloride channel family protein
MTMIDWNALHFLRPAALWALLALPVIAALWTWRRRRHSGWQQAVDAHLLPHLLVAGGRGGRAGLVLLLGGVVLAVLALAGPSWRQVPQPLWQSPSPLVLALDLSSRITATDLPPSRLLQARAKLATLLRERQGGEVALLAYADDAFTVAPLTADMANIALYLDALDPDVMPRDGQRADRAIEAAVKLLQQSGARGGDILLLTDQADAEATRAAASASAQGIHVSVLGLGTAAGVAYRADNGQIAQARLDAASLRALAAAGGGAYAPVASDEGDLRSLGVLIPRASAGDSREGEGRAWRDEGFWLLPPLLLIALLAFRRRALLGLVLVCASLPMTLPSTAYAADGETRLWKRADQVQQAQVAAGVDAYRRGDFSAAQAQFEGVDTDVGWYNLGNALARQGQYDAAIDAYDRALAKHPGMADAVANRAAVDAARKRKPPPSSSSDQGKPQPGQGKPSPGQGQPQDAGGKTGQPDPAAPPQPGKAGQTDTPAEPRNADPAAQQQADAAQRERMRQALQRQPQAGDGPQRDARAGAQTAEKREQRQAVEAWMRRVPDDPGALLRAKFQLENERRKQEGR